MDRDPDEPGPSSSTVNERRVNQSNLNAGNSRISISQPRRPTPFSDFMRADYRPASGTKRKNFHRTDTPNAKRAKKFSNCYVCGNIGHFARKCSLRVHPHEANNHRSTNMSESKGSQNRSSLNKNTWRPHVEANTSSSGKPSRYGYHPYKNNNNNRLKNDEPRRQNKDRMGFNRLQFIANSEPQRAFKIIMESKNAFIEIINAKFDRVDLYALILACIAHISQSSFFETKCNILMDICNTDFVTNLKHYLIDLPYVERKQSNSLYWNDQNTFWKNFITFMEFITNTSPTLAIKICRPLVQSLMASCLDILKQRHDYQLPDDYTAKLADIKNKIKDLETQMKKQISKASSKNNKETDELPPEDFRQLSLLPTTEDLLQKRPYVRPNIIDGAYQDQEHYLDVQFRLLREDCFGPLRKGIHQFIEEPNKNKYDNIRIFRNVKFVQTYVSQTNIGFFAKIDIKNKNFFKRLSNSKRFIYGSLVLFTKDNCKSFIVATIIDREDEYLQRGLIPVSLFNSHNHSEKIQIARDTYTMIESDVYFEPYYNVLKVLRGIGYNQKIPMQKYIVDVNPNPRKPSYLLPDKVYTYSKDLICDEEDVDDDDVIMKLPTGNELKFTVLQDETWPDKDLLNFDESQAEAFKLALTHEFVVIQGPPGTGKTHVGIKIAQTLYRNLRNDLSLRGCLILVICYTNHALDQFLEAILKFTNSVVRIGNQSKNDAMKLISLNTLRHNARSSMFIERKIELRNVIAAYREKQTFLDVLLYGVISIHLIDVEEIQHFKNFYSNTKDPLMSWLFQNYENYMSNDVDIDSAQDDYNSNVINFEKQNRKRTGFKEEENENDNDNDNQEYFEKIALFSIQQETKLILTNIELYNASKDDVHKYTIASYVNYLQSRISLFNDMKSKCDSEIKPLKIEVTNRTNFDHIKPLDRWRLYFRWIRHLIVDIEEELNVLQNKVQTASTMYDEARMMLDIEVIRNRKIIGMTTSGAAKMHKMLQEIAPPIVIVEEAAEVLEQHIIASLTDKCQHLILIGDHQQLRPSASHMKLAKHYNMEVSLFERMISNGVHSRRLGVQHRMRPALAALVAPHVYRDLRNHHSVHLYPDVRGLTTNLYFFTHHYKEDDLEDNMSRTNLQEADLILGLADYLMKQGYAPHVVTILTAYKGQMFYMRKKSGEYPHLNNVNIQVVDNYQGEESDIILLSLVRNNDENKVGFLATPNRICVALSRAKHGLYIFGNIEILKSQSELWQNIATTLESTNSLGSTLTLRCENHPDTLTEINKLEDFNKVYEGGCGKQCQMTLPRCDHKCELICHGYDRGHTQSKYTKCKQRCERVLCEHGHVCPLMCAEDCQPCRVLMPRTLPCGHEQKIYCYLEPNDPKVKCETRVEVILPDCEHKNEKYCYEKIKDVRCQEKCMTRLDKCGHSCMLNCHVKNDPHHENYECRKQCAKLKKGCSLTEESADNDSSHWCNKRCYEDCDVCHVKILKSRNNCKHLQIVSCHVDVNEIPCQKKCSRMAKCGLHFCKKKCKDDCGNCNELVKKEIPSCKHTVVMKCSDEPVQKLCTEKCTRTMECGHKCTGLCRNECDVSTCVEPSERSAEFPCGHVNKLPCNVPQLPEGPALRELLRRCAAACGAALACGHDCGASCGACAQGRRHAACTQPCAQLNICGHKCKQPCNQVCPPCREKCEIRCDHSQCKKLCGEPCTPCKEKCTARCGHGACGRLCSQPCSWAGCARACGRALACGHACRGLCGAPCPPACRACRPDAFPTDLMGDQFDDDTRLILLEDCGHIMDVETIDNIVNCTHDIIQLPKCPLCRCPIVNTHRYKMKIMALYKNEINPIKIRVYGTNKEIENKKKQFLKNLDEFYTKYKSTFTSKDYTICCMVFKHLKFTLMNKKKFSKLDLDMGLICLDILDMITECVATYLSSGKQHFKEEIQSQVNFLCKDFISSLKFSRNINVSQQQQKDLALEISRLNSMVQLSKLDIPPPTEMPTTVTNALKEATNAIFSYFIFETDKAMNALKNLETALKLSGVIIKRERALIVKAIGLRAGHWYKCPNGHFYCIGECGGANQISRCADCGVPIGGTSHRLQSGNAHAPEMDNSRFAAWSEEANNMANFIL